eukprot:TRINITY_DN1200_c0_g1_i1.p1 TRINITY_DN1200_c0_g1~~TRINITY_DN1200_c0_g1_i1.p1  ORF type:complete len:520 (-),score=109.98 TRINITY_DN1200_c0_g1_i1:100-1659(-)
MTKRFGFQFIINENDTLDFYENEFEDNRVALTSENIKCTFKDRCLSVSYNKIEGIDLLTLFDTHSILDYWAIKGEPTLYCALSLKTPTFVCCTDDTLMLFKSGRELPTCKCPETINNIISLQANNNQIIVSDGVTQLIYDHDLSLMTEKRYPSIKTIPIGSEKFICVNDYGIELCNWSLNCVEGFEGLNDFEVVDSSLDEKSILLNEGGRTIVRSTKDFKIVEELCGAGDRMGFLGNDHIVILTDAHSCIWSLETNRCIWSTTLLFDNFCGNFLNNIVLFGQEFSLEKRFVGETVERFEKSQNPSYACWIAIESNFYVCVDWKSRELMNSTNINCNWPHCNEFMILLAKDCFFVKQKEEKWMKIESVEDFAELSKFNSNFFCLTDKNFAAMYLGDQWVIFNHMLNFVCRSKQDLKKMMKKLHCPVIFNTNEYLLLELSKKKMSNQQKQFSKEILDLITIDYPLQPKEYDEIDSTELEKQLQTSHYLHEKNLVDKSGFHYKPNNLVNQPRKHGHITYRPY